MLEKELFKIKLSDVSGYFELISELLNEISLNEQFISNRDKEGILSDTNKLYAKLQSVDYSGSDEEDMVLIVYVDRNGNVGVRMVEEVEVEDTDDSVPYADDSSYNRLIAKTSELEKEKELLTLILKLQNQYSSTRKVDKQDLEKLIDRLNADSEDLFYASFLNKYDTSKNIEMLTEKLDDLEIDLNHVVAYAVSKSKSEYREGKLLFMFIKREDANGLGYGLFGGVTDNFTEFISNVIESVMN